MVLFRRLVVGLVILAMLAAFAFNKGSEVEVNCGPAVSYSPTYAGVKVAQKTGDAVNAYVEGLADGEWSTYDTFRAVKGTVDTLTLWFVTLRNAVLGQPAPEQAVAWENQQEADAQNAVAACCPPTAAPTAPAPGTPPPPSVPLDSLTGEQLARQAAMQVFPADMVPTMVAIAGKESTWNPKARNAGGYSGLWQINPGLAAGKNWQDPVVNAQLAYRVYKEIGLERGWTTYASGSYKELLRPASSVAVAPVSTITTSPRPATTTQASAAIRALAKLKGFPATPHRDPQGLPAFDVMSSGPANTALAEEFRANHDAYGLRYVISQMRIASPKSDWRWRPYTPITGSGDFRHTGHVHVSYTEGPVASTPAPAPAPDASKGSAGCSADAMPPVKIITWNSYHGWKYPDERRGNDIRVVRGMLALTKSGSIIGAQELSDSDRKAAVNTAMDGAGWSVVATHTSHPIYFDRAVWDLVDDDTTEVYERGDAIEGNDQGDRYVVTAVLRNRATQQTITVVNMHQLPHIQKNGVLNPKQPKRTAMAVAAWKVMVTAVTKWKPRGPVIVVGDMNYDGDPQGIYASAGLTMATSVLGGAPTLRKRIIDHVMSTAGMPTRRVLLGKFGSDHSAVLVEYGPSAAAAVGDAAVRGGGVVPNFPGQATTDQAIQWFASRDGAGGWSGRCLAAVGRAYGHAGTTMVNGHYYATGQWDAMPARYRHTDGSTPPRGALVFWDTSNVAGHIALSAGGGKVWTTDAPGGGIGLVDIDVIDGWGTRLGWSESWFVGKTRSAA